jgi:hypothetical protein
VIVERGCPDSDHHVAGNGCGEWMVRHDGQLVESAVSAQNERLHGVVAAYRFALCRLDYGQPPV